MSLFFFSGRDEPVRFVRKADGRVVLCGGDEVPEEFDGSVSGMCVFDGTIHEITTAWTESQRDEVGCWDRGFEGEWWHGTFRPATDAEILAVFSHTPPDATGADVSAALNMKGRDLDLARMQCHVPGTKSHRRDRHGIVIEAWAAPYLAELRTILPAAPLFPGCTQNGASKHHEHVGLKIARVPDYTLRDARHSVAVRMRRAGKSFEAIAQQLRTSVAQAVATYSQFTADDMAAELGTLTTDLTTRTTITQPTRRAGHR